MGFIIDLFRWKPSQSNFSLTDYVAGVESDAAFRDYAVQICINKIANAMTQCDIQTFEKGNQIKSNNWYLLNVEPNRNQNAKDFWNKLVYQMVFNPDGALVIQDKNGYLIVADSYDLEEKAVYDNVYRNIVVNNYTFQSVFSEREVLRFKLNNTNIKKYVDKVYESYGKLMTSSIKYFNRKNSTKLIVKLSTMFNQLKSRVTDTGETEADLILDDLFKNRLKGYFSDSDSATPIEEGLEVEDRTTQRNGNSNTRDISAIFDDIINTASDAFGIPRGLLKGDVADIEAMTDNFITFCINPIASLLEDEFNRKLYGKENILENTKLKIKTNTIKGYDPTKLASSAEALYRIRTVNANWVRKLLREEEIDEAWANEYAETKNYQTVNQHLKGGESE